LLTLGRNHREHYILVYVHIFVKLRFAALSRLGIERHKSVDGLLADLWVGREFKAVSGVL
jgi:hypothetical protein